MRNCHLTKKMIDGELTDFQPTDEIMTAEDGIAVIDQVCAVCGKSLGLAPVVLRPVQIINPNFLSDDIFVQKSL